MSPRRCRLRFVTSDLCSVPDVGTLQLLGQTEGITVHTATMKKFQCSVTNVPCMVN